MSHPIPQIKSCIRWFPGCQYLVTLGTLIATLCPALPLQGQAIFELAQMHAVSQGGRVVFIEGTSMEPRLTDQDLIVVVPVPWHELTVGDIVQFYVSEEVRNERNSQATWIHQVAAKEGAWIRTVGVNNPDLDPFWVHKRDVLGKAVAVYIGGAKEVPTVSERAMAYLKIQSEAGITSEK